MSILIIAEHDNSELYPGTLNTVTAGRVIGDAGGDKDSGDLHVLVAGHGIGKIADTCAGIAGVARVLAADAEIYAHPSTEDMAALIIATLGANKQNYTHVLAPASTFGKALIPYAAALCDLQSISDISEVVDADTFVRPIYAGNAMATVKSSDPVKMITVRTTVFELAEAEGGSAQIENIAAANATERVKFVEQTLSPSERPELTSARVVVSGGRGMQNGENFVMLEKLADRLGGAVGASRAAVDAGFVPNDYQVGQTGKVVAPDLYLAVGISGAIQHLAGMKDSKCIVAINNDEEAPIFQVADYSWNEDLFVAVPALQAALEK